MKQTFPGLLEAREGEGDTRPRSRAFFFIVLLMLEGQNEKKTKNRLNSETDNCVNGHVTIIPLHL